MNMITSKQYWAPTWANQLREATKLLNEKGPEAINNPHAMIGRTCGCMECFCCAAATVYKAYQDNYVEEMTHTAKHTPQGFEIVETVDGGYMVLCQGIQWGKGPRDLSGCSSDTWPTKQAAYEAIVERERNHE